MRRKYPWWSEGGHDDRPVVDVAPGADPIEAPEPLQEPALAPKPMLPPAPLERNDDQGWLFERGDAPEAQTADDPEDGSAEAAETEPEGPEAVAGADPGAAAAEPLEPAVEDGADELAQVRPPEPVTMREPAEEGVGQEPAAADPTMVWGNGPAPVDDDLAAPPEEIAVDESATAESEVELEPREDMAPVARPEEAAEVAEVDRSSEGMTFAESLQDRIAGFERVRERIAGLEGTRERTAPEALPTEDLDRLEERVGALEALEERISRLEALEERVGDLTAAIPNAERVDQLDQRVDELASTEERVARIEKAMQAIVRRVRRVDEVRAQLVEVTEGLRGLEQLEAHVGALRSEVEAVRASSSGTSGRAKAVDELESRTRGLDARVRQVEDIRPRIDQLQREVRGLEGAPDRLDRVERAVRELDRLASQVEELTGRVASIGPAALRAEETEEALRTVVGRVRELMKLNGRVGELEARVPSSLEERLDEIGANAAEARDRVAALDERISQGDIVSGEVTTLAERVAKTDADVRGRMSALETWMRQIERSIVARLDDLGARAPADAAGATLQDAIVALRTELDALRGSRA